MAREPELRAAHLAGGLGHATVALTGSSRLANSFRGKKQVVLFRETDGAPRDQHDAVRRRAESDKAFDTIRFTARLLGSAQDYSLTKRELPCDFNLYSPRFCLAEVETAEAGQKLLTRPELTAVLPQTAIERLRQVLSLHETSKKLEIDSVARSGALDPAQFCIGTYALASACRRAIANDQTALDNQKLPVYVCGLIAKGEFITPADVASDPERTTQRLDTRTWRSGFDYQTSRRAVEKDLSADKLILETMIHVQ